MENNQETLGKTITDTVDIPKDLFIEERNPEEQEYAYKQNGEAKGIDVIYTFLQADYETRGYNDALTNPDDSYKSDNINLFRQDLFILIQKANTYYESFIKELDFHISSRGRAGLIDLVEALETKKEMVLDYLEKIKLIHADAENGLGVVQRITLSYQRGFMRGLSALTKYNILNRQL